jgi:xylulokinase
MPLERTESEEGSAFGAALLGGVAGGVFGDVSEAVARCVRVVDRPVEPDPTLRNAYGELRERFRALYPTLRPFGAGTAPRA